MICGSWGVGKCFFEPITEIKCVMELVYRDRTWFHLLKIQGIGTWWVIIDSKSLGTWFEYSCELILTWNWNWDIFVNAWE